MFLLFFYIVLVGTESTMGVRPVMGTLSILGWQVNEKYWNEQWQQVTISRINPRFVATLTQISLVLPSFRTSAPSVWSRPLTSWNTRPILTHVKTNTEYHDIHSCFKMDPNHGKCSSGRRLYTDTRPHCDGICRLNTYARQVNKSEWQGWGMLHAWGHERLT